VIHRHLDYGAGTPLWERGAAAVDDLLDRGDLGDWTPLARAVAADPFGALAVTVERICDAHPMYGTAPLWRAYVDRCRARFSGPLHHSEPVRAWNLAELRRAAGLTQVELAKRLGMSQSDLSKLERRSDLRMSTLQAYVAAVGGQVRILADRSGEPPVTLRFGPRTGHHLRNSQDNGSAGAQDS
jgi:hypothetical protein